MAPPAAARRADLVADDRAGGCPGHGAGAHEQSVAQDRTASQANALRGARLLIRRRWVRLCSLGTPVHLGDLTKASH